MMVKNIHVIQPQAFQALVESCPQMFSPPVAVGPRLSRAPGLGRHHQLIAIRAELAAEHRPKPFPPHREAARNCRPDRNA